MKFSLTITPYRLTPESKVAAVSSAIEVDSQADAVRYVADQLKSQPEQRSLSIVIERTDV